MLYIYACCLLAAIQLYFIDLRQPRQSDVALSPLFISMVQKTFITFVMVSDDNFVHLNFFVNIKKNKTRKRKKNHNKLNIDPKIKTTIPFQYTTLITVQIKLHCRTGHETSISLIYGKK